MSEDLVSIVITSYNHEAYIERAIESAINQQVEKQIIVIDDCSTDNSREIISKYEKQNKITALYNDSNIGACRSANIAIKHCVGKYINYLASDDFILQPKLVKQLQYLKTNSHIRAVFSLPEIYDEFGHKLSHSWAHKLFQYHDYTQNEWIHFSV